MSNISCHFCITFALSGTIKELLRTIITLLWIIKAILLRKSPCDIAQCLRTTKRIINLTTKKTLWQRKAEGDKGKMMLGERVKGWMKNQRIFIKISQFQRHLYQYSTNRGNIRYKQWIDIISKPLNFAKQKTWYLWMWGKQFWWNFSSKAEQRNGLRLRFHVREPMYTRFSSDMTLIPTCYSGWVWSWIMTSSTTCRKRLSAITAIELWMTEINKLLLICIPHQPLPNRQWLCNLTTRLQ